MARSWRDANLRERFHDERFVTDQATYTLAGTPVNCKPTNARRHDCVALRGGVLTDSSQTPNVTSCNSMLSGS
jgi:hypothetical protein